MIDGVIYQIVSERVDLFMELMASELSKEKVNWIRLYDALETLDMWVLGISIGRMSCGKEAIYTELSNVFLKPIREKLDNKYNEELEK